MDITLENYEFAFFQYEEGLLTPEERRQVEAFCQEHPELGEELGLAMECPRLQPLEVEAPKGRRAIIIPLWAKRALSAAACVALLIGIGVQLWQPNSPEDQGPVVASWDGGLSCLPQPVRADRERPTERPVKVENSRKVLKDFESFEDFEDSRELSSPEAEAPVAWEEAPVSWGEPGALYAESSIQQIDSEEFQLLLAQNYIEASELLAQADAPAPKSEEELAHPIATWLARQKEAAFMQLAEFFTQKFNH